MLYEKERKKNMPRGNNSWNKALRSFNQGKSGWCVPRKGTADYAEVRRLQRTIEGGGGSMASSGPVTRRMKRGRDEGDGGSRKRARN